MEPPANLSKFYSINSDLDPQNVLQSFSSDSTEGSDSQGGVYRQPNSDGAGGLLAPHRQANTSGGSGGGGILSLLGSGGGMGGQGEGGMGGEGRPSSRGSAVGVESPFEEGTYVYMYVCMYHTCTEHDESYSNCYCMYIVTPLCIYMYIQYVHTVVQLVYAKYP